jgi:hypothetical protein
MHASGLRNSTIHPGQVISIPDDAYTGTFAEPDQSALGQMALNQDNARLDAIAATKAASEEAARAGNFVELPKAGGAAAGWAPVDFTRRIPAEYQVDSGIVDPDAYVAGMPYTEQMANAFGFMGEAIVGFGKGLINGVPAAATAAVKGWGYIGAATLDLAASIDGYDSHYTLDATKSLEQHDGRILDYNADAPGERFGGFFGEILSPAAYVKGAQLAGAGVRLAAGTALDSFSLEPVAAIESAAVRNIEYGALDGLGRPTGVSAVITEEMLGTGSEASRAITPPGWSGNGAAFNEARGHLLARQLGGSGDVAENLVTLQQYPANSPVMSSFEAQVAEAVRGGEAVSYSSTPLYDSSALVPRGITITARGTGGYSLDVTVLNPLARRVPGAR